MKKQLLPILFLSLATTAFAQISGVGVSPIGATPDDSITFYVDPSQMCHVNGTDIGPNPPSLRIHSGVDGWTNVVEAGALVNPTGTPGQPYSVVGFTDIGGGLWKKTIKPSAYYNKQGILGINFVFNGGPDDGDRWAAEGKKLDPIDASCNDFYLPFPISSDDFGIVAVKTRKAGTATMLYPANPNPATGKTAVRFHLTTADNVRVRILNILGETVTTLATGPMAAGDQTFTWNAVGQKAGIYFYTVETSTTIASSKIQVVR